MGGVFCLRIEDTDRKRYNETALHDLMRDLKWLGLQWDEGPGCEKDCSPYFQSERLHIYNEQIKKLLDSGDAYYCFCTEERLQEVRAEQEKSHVPVTGYYKRNQTEASPPEVGGQGQNPQRDPAQGQDRLGPGRRIPYPPEPDLRVAQGTLRGGGNHLRAETPRHHREGPAAENRGTREGARRQGRGHRGHRAGEPVPQKKINWPSLGKRR